MEKLRTLPNSFNHFVYEVFEYICDNMENKLVVVHEFCSKI